MPDITELLTLAGRAGSAGPDLAAVELRAQSLRRRERVVRAAGVLAVVLVAVPLLQLRGGPDALEQLPADRRTGPSPSISSAIPQPLSTTPPLGVGSLPAGSVPSATALPAGPVSQPTTGPSASSNGSEGPSGKSSAEPGTASDSYPARASCQVATTALGPDQTATCRFTATRAGGWYVEYGAGTFVGSENATHAAEVLVERAGRITRYSPDYDDECRNDVVRPGDRVTVTVRQAQTKAYVDFDVGAGEGFDCSTKRVRP